MTQAACWKPLTASLSRLDAFKSHSPQLGEASDMLASAQIQIEEAVGELTRYLDHFEADPERQQYVEERLSAIYDLARKHRIQPQELPALQQQLIDELEGQQQQAADAERLQEELVAYQAHYRQLSEKLSAQRSKGAAKLAKAVTQEIQRLGMPGGRIELQLTPFGRRQLPGNRAGNRRVPGQCQPRPAPPNRWQGSIWRRTVTHQPRHSGHHRTDVTRPHTGV